MNTKRQTVWLVSMLSLMVVLSAYYLFTQDIDSPNVLTDGTQTEETAGNATEAAADGSEVVANETGGTISGADQEVLDLIEEQGLAYGGIFSELKTKREAQNAEEENRILAEISKTETKQEESVAAIAELEQFEEKVSKISTIESELMKEYEIAMVSQEGDHFKVIVSSETLEKKQAADIIKLVMSTMEVDADQVSVQYVTQ